MKKIPSLFCRNYDGDRLVRDEVVPGCEWVLRGEGRPTEKVDGTALGFWDGLEQDSIISSFEGDSYSVPHMRKQIDRTGIDVLFAWYDDPWGYSGEAFLLFRKDGEYYTVNGSHCSCYGLEGQWSPVRVTIDYLKKELENGMGFLDNQDYYATKLSNLLLSMEN